MDEKIQQYITIWRERCYGDDIPDAGPDDIFDRVPSYKRIVLCILKNDFRDIGIQPQKSEYYSQLKRIEIEERAKKEKIKSLFDI